MNEVTTINVTDAATAKIESLVAENVAHDSEITGLRIFIVGGGCSGFQYGFAFTKTTSDDDHIFKIGDTQLVCDPMSLMYLAGATVDYQTQIGNERFVINNPNASHQCGCGQSFSA